MQLFCGWNSILSSDNFTKMSITNFTIDFIRTQTNQETLIKHYSPRRHQMGRAKRIWYLSPMRAAKVQASLRIRAVSPSLIQAVSQEEPSDRKPDPWPL